MLQYTYIEMHLQSRGCVSQITGESTVFPSLKWSSFMLLDNGGIGGIDMKRKWVKEKTNERIIMNKICVQFLLILHDNLSIIFTYNPSICTGLIGLERNMYATSSIVIHITHNEKIVNRFYTMLRSANFRYDNELLHKGCVQIL